MIEVFHLKPTGLARERNTLSGDLHLDMSGFGIDEKAIADVWKNADYWRPFGLAYEKVAIFHGHDLEQAFERTNTIDRPWTQNQGVTVLSQRARSTSPGDVMVKDGVARYVASIGFEVVPDAAARVPLSDVEFDEVLAADRLERHSLTPARLQSWIVATQETAALWAEGARKHMDLTLRVAENDPGTAWSYRRSVLSEQANARETYARVRGLLCLEGDVKIVRRDDGVPLYTCDTVESAQHFINQQLYNQDRAGFEAGFYAIRTPDGLVPGLYEGKAMPAVQADPEPEASDAPRG